jgi:ribosomal protein L7/L12
MIVYTLLVVFVSAFVLAVFWFVAKTIGKLPVVKDSMTLDDIRDFINPELAEKRSHAQEEKSLRSEALSMTVRALADAGDKLGATEMCKHETGFSLMESKKTVEAYMSNRSHEKRRTRADEP